MKHYGRLAKVGFAWGTLSRLIGEFIAIPTTVILARLLSPTEFGIAATASFFVQLAGRVTNFGFNTALMQLKELRPEHTSSVFVVNLLFGSALWIGLFLGADTMAAFFHTPDIANVLRVAAFSFLIGSFGSVPSALLSRDMKFKSTVLVDTSYNLTTYTCAIAMALLGYSYWSLVHAQIIGTIVSTVLRFYLSGWRPSLRFSRDAFNDVLGFGFGLYMKRLLDSAALNLDNMVVGRTIGVAALGLYDKAFTTMNKVVLALSTAGPTVSFRIFSIIHEDDNRFRLAYRKVLLTATLVGYPALTWMIVSAPELFTVMFGERWAPAVLPFQILCVAGMVKLLIAYASVAIQSRGWIWGEVWRQLLYVALILGGVTVGSRFDVAGAAAGVLFATLVMGVLMHSLLKRAASLSWRDLLAPQMPAVVCSLGMVGVLLFAPAVSSNALGLQIDAPWLLVLLRVVVGGLYYGLFMLFCRFAAVRALVEETLAEFTPWIGRRLGTS
jgi:O-antigen/teichoic acid export membrane protein